MVEVTQNINCANIFQTKTIRNTEEVDGCILVRGFNLVLGDSGGLKNQGFSGPDAVWKGGAILGLDSLINPILKERRPEQC